MEKIKRKVDEKISYKNGVTISLNNSLIFLDPIVSTNFSIVSHAHLDHSPYLNLGKPITTKETEELIRVREPSFKAFTVKQNKKINFEEFSIKLIDSEHILGSSMILVEEEEKILYTGDFRRREIDEDVDVLIMETTYGLPNFIFPPLDEEVEKMIKWIKLQNLNGKKVEIGAYALGKAQEIIKILNENNIIPSVSKTIENFNKVYKKFGEKLETDKRSDVIIRPLHEVLNNPLPNHAHCLVSGWGIINRFPFKTFIISDHLDFKGLVEFVENVNPKIVYTFHGYSKEFADYLNKKGYKAFPLV